LFFSPSSAQTLKKADWFLEKKACSVYIYTMPHRHYRLVFVSILCLLILVAEIDSLRVRVAALRLSATLGKAASCLKKKAPVNNSPVPARTIPSPMVVVPPRAEVDDL
jgi:hypothetical protein